MCGICGIVNLKAGPAPDREVLLRMMARLEHRGPDSSGYYRDDQAALGHTRLSIIDLETGAQPLDNEDASLWITFNGEIYNYLELAAELTSRGHTLKTRSDTEVIVHAYEEWGTGCFKRFNGQWALALWDARKQALLLCRDRFGIRPLYYAMAGRRLLFASEIKALFADPAIPREFDPEGLSETFTFWSPIAPRTAFRGVRELEPGAFALFQASGMTVTPYWTPSFPERGRASRDREEVHAPRLREHLLQACRLRFTRSDVPVGAYLSGGIDSSVSAALVNTYTDAPLKTFSLRFSDSEFDEGRYQGEMVERLGADHRAVTVSHRDIAGVFPEVVWHTERPVLRTAPAPMFLLSRLVRDAGYKVVVTGEGADEVLAGYDIFREAKVRRFLARNPSSTLRQGIFGMLYPWMARSPGHVPAMARAFFSTELDPGDPAFSHRPRWRTTAFIKRILSPDWREQTARSDVAGDLLSRLPAAHDTWEDLSRAQWLEYVSLLSSYILSAQGDRMLMAHSVEGRFPFLDCDLVDFANTLPARQKLLGLDEKHLLKLACGDLIPEPILLRPKQPYRAPDAASFFMGKSIEWVDEMVGETRIKRAGIFSPGPVSRLVGKCRKHKGQGMGNTDNMAVVAVLSTMLLHHHYIKADGSGFAPARSAPPGRVIDRAAPEGR